MSKHVEDNIQIACVEYFKLQYPALIIHHSPNGGKRAVKINKNGTKYCPEGTRFKKLGVLAGYPDITIIAVDRVIFVELKEPKGTLSPAQKIVHAKLISLGHRVYTCFSLHDFIQVCELELPLTNKNR